MEDLFKAIKKITPLAQADEASISTFFTVENTGADHLLISAGAVPRHIYFLSSGIVKGYHNADGKMVVDHLIEPGSFFTSFESFVHDRPSPDTYQTVTDSVVYTLSKPNYEHLSAQHAFISVLTQEIVSDSLVCKTERVQDFQTLTAKERYLKLLTQRPSLVSQVSVSDLSAYLGIAPPSLSRIRNQIAK